MSWSNFEEIGFLIDDSFRFKGSLSEFSLSQVDFVELWLHFPDDLLCNLSYSLQHWRARAFSLGKIAVEKWKRWAARRMERENPEKSRKNLFEVQKMIYFSPKFHLLAHRVGISLSSVVSKVHRRESEVAIRKWTFVKVVDVEKWEFSHKQFLTISTNSKRLWLLTAKAEMRSSCVFFSIYHDD